ncbi:MAG: type I glyceraldehyde-3-phosphate dehydrogenase [Mollicutes bacterium]|jgi:glyceraldehyde 3-phosphate dehydrogenase|nr:type I glyceraldehyde-3-phosphate dehydrogenase [Mollicutes bacterium]
MKKIAINGFGRIGRLAFRELINRNDYEVVAINDLTDSETLAYLLKYDSNHRTFNPELISHDAENLIYDGKKIRIFAEKDAANLPWKKLEVDVVLECTGFYTSLEKSMAHINAGAKKVLISAPAKGDLETVVFGVNEDILDGSEQVVSAASCTTNCLAPVLKVIEDNIGIVKGFMTTIHAYTNDQATLDVPHNKGINSRRGRACAVNIVPASTGAASAIGLVIPSLKGKFDGTAFRVPVSDGSVIDVTMELKRNTSIEELNELFRNNQSEALKFTMDPIVSSDIIGSRVGALVDGQSTNVIEHDGKQLVKVVAWYDNEMGYTVQMIRTFDKLMK